MHHARRRPGPLIYVRPCAVAHNNIFVASLGHPLRQPPATTARLDGLISYLSCCWPSHYKNSDKHTRSSSTSIPLSQMDYLQTPSARKGSKRRLSNPPAANREEISTQSAASLRSLIDSLDASQLQFVHSLIQSRLRHDLLKVLPLPVVARVLSQIDLASVFQASRQSSTWLQALVPNARNSRRNDVLWRAIFDARRAEMSALAKGMLRSFSAPELFRAVKLDYLLARNWTRNLSRSVSIECHASAVITCLHVASERIVTASDDNSVCIWDATSCTKAQMTLRGHEGGVWALSVAHNLLVVGSTDRSLSVWDTATGRRLHELCGHTSTVRCVEIQDDLVVSGSRDGTLRVWDWASGTCLHVLRGHSASVRCLAAVGPSRFVSGSYDNSVRIWDVRRGRCLSVLAGHENKVYCLAVYCPVPLSDMPCDASGGSGDACIHPGALVYSGSMDATVRVWNPRTGVCVRVISGFKSLVGLMEIKPIGNRAVLVAGSTDGSIQVWDAAHVAPLAAVPFAHHNSITCLSLNNYALVTGSEGVVRMWDLRELLSGAGRGGAPPKDGVDSDDDMRLASPVPPAPPALKLIGNLVEQVEMVWRVAVSDRFAVIAYQSHGSTRMRVMDFVPTGL